MTTKKETTKEEMIADNVKKTLEDKFIQNIVGSNAVKTNPFMYGQLGVAGGEQTYNEVMFSEKANKIKQETYNQKKKEGEQLGVVGEPTYETNYDISLKIAKQVNEVMAMAKLKDLEKIVKTVAKGFEFEIPENLKNYSMQEVLVKAVNGKGELDESKLNEDEQKVLATQQLLSQAYTRGVSLIASQSNYFADLNFKAKQIMDSYKPAGEAK